MVTTITKSERKFEVKLLQLRITAGIRQKLQKVSKRSGLDTSASVFGEWLGEYLTPFAE